MTKTMENIIDCWNSSGVFSEKDKRCYKLEKFGHCRNCPIYIKMGRILLDRPLPASYKQELTDRYKEQTAPVELPNKSAFVFKAGSEWLALRESIVTEVVDMGPIHSIPHKNSRLFRGVVNIRGRLEICVSIGGVLRMEGRHRKVRGFPTPERLIIAIKGGKSVVFPVTRVMGPIRYHQKMLTPLPVTVSGSKAVYTKGIIGYDGKKIALLDDVILFRILTRNLA